MERKGGAAQVTKIVVFKKNGSAVSVYLMPHKDGSGYSFVNITKGHICPCKFKTEEDALADIMTYPENESYKMQIKGYC